MEKQIKILSVNISDSSGGAARAAYRIQQAVNKQEVHSRMLVKHKGLNDDNSMSVSQFDHPNIIKNSFRYIQKKFKNKLQHRIWNKYPNREDFFMSDLRSESLHGALQKIDFDILHLHWINLRFFHLKELKTVNKPIVWTLHDCWAFTGICHYFYECEKYKSNCGDCPFLHSGVENDLSRRIWKKKNKIYQGLDLHIVTPSRWLGEAAKQSSLFQKFPVTVIPNPIDTKIFCPGSREDTCKALRLKSDKTYILYGAMNAVKDSRKGFKELLAALNVFKHSELKNKTELLLFGAEENDVKMSAPIEVTYLGMINNDETMVKIYQSAAVMVVPSLSENLSNVIMESLACGTPVAAFNIGGNSDMIDHKQNGYLAEPINPEDLAAGIAWCLENNTSGELSRNARAKVEEKYSMERVGEKYVELYKGLVK